MHINFKGKAVNATKEKNRYVTLLGDKSAEAEKPVGDQNADPPPLFTPFLCQNDVRPLRPMANALSGLRLSPSSLKPPEHK